MTPMKSRWLHWFWPEITDVKSARTVAKKICGALLALTGLALFDFMVALNKVEGSQRLGLNPWSLLNVVFFLGIAWGIHRMSRTAAVLGLIFWVWVVAWLRIMAENGPAVIPWIVLLAFELIHGVRATFAYHRYKTMVDPAVSDTFA